MSSDCQDCGQSVAVVDAPTGPRGVVRVAGWDAPRTKRKRAFLRCGACWRKCGWDEQGVIAELEEGRTT